MFIVFCFCVFTVPSYSSFCPFRCAVMSSGISVLWLVYFVLCVITTRFSLVVAMRIALNILNLQHCILNWKQLNYNRICKPFTSPPPHIWGYCCYNLHVFCIMLLIIDYCSYGYFYSFIFFDFQTRVVSELCTTITIL